VKAELAATSSSEVNTRRRDSQLRPLRLHPKPLAGNPEPRAEYGGSLALRFHPGRKPSCARYMALERFPIILDHIHMS